MNANQSKSEKPLDIAIYFRSKARSAAVAFFVWDLVRRYWSDLDFFTKTDYNKLVKLLAADYEIYVTQNADIFNPSRVIAWYDLITEFKKTITELFPVIMFLKHGGWVPQRIDRRSIYSDNRMLNVIENEINKD